MQRATSLPASIYSSAASQLLLEAFPHLRLVQGESLEAVEVAFASSRLGLLDILNQDDIGVLILSKFLTVEHRAALACTCTMGKDVTATQFFRENLLFADCLKLTYDVFKNLVTRTLSDVKEGLTVALLDISGCKHLSWYAVAGALRDMGHLEHVCMRGGPLVKVASSDLVQVGPEGAKAVAAALDPNQQDTFIGSLKTLNLQDNALCGIRGRGTYDPSGIKAMAEALLSNASLKTLNLQGTALCGIDVTGRGTYDPSGIKAVAEALAFNGSLNTLILATNNIGPEGVKALAVALTPNAEGVFNTSLQTLNILGNYLRVEEARALVNAVKQRNAPTKLCGSLLDVEELDLSREGLRSVDAILLANDLVFSNESLTSLNLWGSDIGEEGAQALVDAVKLCRRPIKLCGDLLLNNKKVDITCTPMQATLLANDLLFNGGSYDNKLNTVTVTKKIKLHVGALRRNEVVELDLRRKGLRDVDAILLGAVLVHSGSLRTLNLAGDSAEGLGSWCAVQLTLDLD
ncbi:hypothetical protein CYMTET_4849 [Cymbomonas tetramitiformis]|uniref:Uncharacterized protein n=1 Tax=Cymbomonas tetramitiformis TaxID=36881 RepID=A0AAE0H0D4_9CHLO|nr:hypothetical protein CYMTET_4849 [Cymbomonas tetramitiformis]